MQSSPCRLENKTPKRRRRCKRIINNGDDRYALKNAPIESQNIRNRNIVLGQGERMSRILEDIETAV